jgi:hypothetical protein
MTETTLLEVANPEPAKLPRLSLWQVADHDRQPRIMVASRFPNLPDFTCDSWCYESALDYVGARDLGGGRLQLRHREQARPDVLLTSVVAPHPGAVEFRVRASSDSGPPPANPLTPNLCWQLKRAPAFASAPDPYPAFVARCFLFTERGCTRLDQTERLPIPVREADDPVNNPVWVQSYLPVWETYRAAGPESWADVSPDAYVHPVVGNLSRDEEHLTAIACARPQALCQAWHDCMHNNPHWAEVDGQPEWRLRIYAMANDPEALLGRVAVDFPDAKGPQDRPT